MVVSGVHTHTHTERERISHPPHKQKQTKKKKQKAISKSSARQRGHPPRFAVLNKVFSVVFKRDCEGED